MNKLLVSPSPHIHSKDSTRSLMMDVVIALLPAVICSFVFYGWREMVVMAVSVASCVLLEWAITKYMLKKPSTIGDMSAVITGMLLALNVPYTTPWWVIVIGSVVSFPTYMTTWGAPQGVVDAVSGPTPLGAISEGLMQGASVQELTSAYSYKDLLFANLGGSAGEVCALALLAGFVYLCIRRVIKPWITLTIFATVAVTSLIFWGINPARFTDPVFNLLTGGLVLGACFMATDYVTSPMSVKGGIVFGVGIGFLTMMIRYFGSYPEGVSFAILIMNSVVPLLNMWFKQKKFGRK